MPTRIPRAVRSVPSDRARPSFVRSIVLFVSVAVASASLAAQAQLVRDIRQVASGSNGNSDPIDMRDAGSRAFFTAMSADGGREPYVTDGTTAGTRRIDDFRLGAAGSDPAVLTAFSGQALLFVRPAVGQHQFALTDGTTQGTQLLGTLGLADDTYRGVRLGNGRFILQKGLSTAAQCFATDLTTAGTVALPALTGFEFSLEHNGLGYGMGLFRAGGFGMGGYDLCVSDGAPAGSTVLATHVVRTPNTLGPGVVVHQGRVYFLRSLNGTIELGSTDGTLAGTINHGVIPGLSSTLQIQTALHSVGTLLAFGANNALWTSNGTGATTAPVAGMPCDTINQMATFAGRLYFSATSVPAATGLELFSSDGTAAGTALVADIHPGLGNGAPINLTASPQGVWLRGSITPTSHALYLCTGPQNLQLVGAVPTGTYRPFVPFAGGVLLSLQDPLVGLEPFFATPTQAPTLLADLRVNPPGIDSYLGVRVRDRLFFTADDGVMGRELWSTDGTAAGTTVVDFTQGAAGTFELSREGLVALGDRVAGVTFRNNGYGVMVSDGTVGGSHALPLPVNTRGAAVATRGELLFVFDGERLFRSDGTVAGTSQLPILSPAVTIAPTLFALSDALVFSGVSGPIFASDGVQPPVLLSHPTFGYPIRVVGDRLLFIDSRGLLATDGTVAGTVVLVPNFSITAEVGGTGDVLHFTDGGSLYRTDGTVAGTVVLAPIPSGLGIERIVSTDANVFLHGSDAATGRELWRYDAATGTIVLVVDLVPGPTTGVTGIARLGDGNTVLFTGHDPASGQEPWISDGTVVGTRLLADVVPGPNGSAPGLLGIAGGNVYLLATDFAVGRELRRVALADVGAASVQSMTAGCAGGSGTPDLDVLGAPRLGEAAFGYRLDGAASASFAAVLIGTQLGSASLAGCELAPAGATASWLAPTTVGGSATFALSIPNAPGLLGLQLTAQGFGLDPGVARGFSGSNALFVVVGS